MADIKIYGVLVNDTTEGVVARTNQIRDEKLGKTQETINEELLNFKSNYEKPETAYDDYVTKDSKNAVKSSGVYDFIVNNTINHLPFVDDNGYLNVWDFENEVWIKKNIMGPEGPAGETGGTIHLIFDTTLIKIDNLGQMTPSKPFRVRVVKQYGETGLDAYKDGCVKWWFNEIEDENNPDGWIGWEKYDENGEKDPSHSETKGVYSGEDMSEFTIEINPTALDSITFVLYIDKKGTKDFDQQNVFIIRDPAIYKLDLTNENSLVPVKEDGRVDENFLETSQAILYYGAEQVPFEKINYSIISHDGVNTATINEEGIIEVKDWLNDWETVRIKVCASLKDSSDLKFYTTYNITKVDGITIYRLQPSTTVVKKQKDGTYNVDFVYANVYKIQSLNTNTVNTKIYDYTKEGLKVLYTYNNKVTDPQKDIYTLAGPGYGIPTNGKNLPSTLDGEVREIDIYLVKDSQDSTDLENFIDHETIPLVENGDDGLNLYLTNESCVINCTSSGTQVGTLFDTQGILMKGTTDMSSKCSWSYQLVPGNGLSSMPTWSSTIPGYLNMGKCTINPEIDQLYVEITAKYPANVGDTFTKRYTITKAKQGEIGESGFKSTVFVRTNKKPDRPLNDALSGGSYENPVPTHYATSGGLAILDEDKNPVKWSDGIPTGKAMIWASNRLFTTSGEQTTTWSDPAQMTDTSTFNVEFSWYDPCPGNPDTDPEYWFDPVNDEEVFEKHSMIWMATQNIQNGDPVMHEDMNGNLTSWTIVRILGEKGDSTLRSLVFARCATQPATPEGGSLTDPMPDPNPALDGTVWHDGIPGGDSQQPVWMSTCTFSSLKGTEVKWSDPQIIKDVPGQYDVEYSMIRENPGDPTNNPENWFDAGGKGLTPEQQTQVWWLAQRWCGIEWSKDGINPGWSDWDVIKVRGEDGKSGSTAIVRMRGDWDEDIQDGDWILCGYTHKDHETGKEIQEEYQDLVYATSGKTQNCYKCLISHRKSEIHDPRLQIYKPDPNTQTEKSEDGYWMKATKYSFLATDLLNAKDIVAEVISSNRLEIMGEVTGDWEGSSTNGNNTIQTRVTTYDGTIVFYYRQDDSQDWKKSVDIGYDFATGSGILRFYSSDGVTPLYNLGPHGLSAADIESPGIKTLSDNRCEFFTNAAKICGYFLGDESTVPGDPVFGYKKGQPFYDSSSGLFLTLSLNPGKFYPSVQLLPNTSTESGLYQNNYNRSLLFSQPTIGTFIPQMTLPFNIVDPITLGSASLVGSNEVYYPAGSTSENYTAKFGRGTIGYACLEPTCKNLKYKEIIYSWVNGGTSNMGTLMPPLREFCWVVPTFTDIHDFCCKSFYNKETGSKINVWNGRYWESISDEYDSTATIFTGYVFEGTGGKSARILLSDDYEHSDFFKFFASDPVNSDILSNPYFVVETKGQTDLMTITDAETTLKNSWLVFKDVLKHFVSESSRCTLTNNSYNSAILEFGLQALMADVDSSSQISRKYTRTELCLAKEIMEILFTGSWFNKTSSEKVIGYIFPEDRIFNFNEESNTFIINSVEKESISYRDVLNGVNEFSNSNSNNISAVNRAILACEGGNLSRYYLMVKSTSSGVGGSYSDVNFSGNNTYKVIVKRTPEDAASDVKIRFILEPVNYFTAWTDILLPREMNSQSSNYYMRVNGNFIALSNEI